MLHKKPWNLIAMVMLLVSSLVLTACTGLGGGGNNGGNNGGGNNGGGNNGGGTEIPDTSGEGSTIDELFEQYKVIYNGNSVTVKDPTNNNQRTTFDALLNRQISVLAEDILYRLFFVYGAGFSSPTDNYELYDGNYSYTISGDINNASVSKFNVVQTPFKKVNENYSYVYENGNFISNTNTDKYDPNSNYNNPNFTEIATFALDSFQDTTISDLGFNLKNAMVGGYTWNGVNGEFNKTTFGRFDYSWKWNYGVTAGDFGYAYVGNNQGDYVLITPVYEFVGVGNGSYNNSYTFVGYGKGDFELNKQQSTFSFVGPNAGNFAKVSYDSNADVLFQNYYNAYKNMFEFELAKLLADPNKTGVSFANYNEAITKIDHLGFTKNDRLNITNYVLNSIIGRGLVEQDDSLLNGDGFNAGILDTLSGEVLNFTNHSLLSVNQHNYKAYSLLIPALVKQSLTTVFGGNNYFLYEVNTFGEPMDQDGDGSVFMEMDVLDSVVTVGEETYYSIYPKMSRSEQQNYDITPNQDELEEGEYPEPEMTPLSSIQSIIFQPKNDVSVLELWFMIGTQSNVKAKFQIQVKYVAQGETYLNEVVKSFTNNKSATFEIEGMYDTGESVAGKNLPWFYDLNISDHIDARKNSSGNYVTTSNLEKTKNFPVMKPYDGAEVGEDDYDLWNNNPFKLGDYPAGNNYLQLQIIVLEAWTMDGSTLTPMNTSDVKFTIGFTDPWF